MRDGLRASLDVTALKILWPWHCLMFAKIPIAKHCFRTALFSLQLLLFVLCSSSQSAGRFLAIWAKKALIKKYSLLIKSLQRRTTWNCVCHVLYGYFGLHNRMLVYLRIAQGSQGHFFISLHVHRLNVVQSACIKRLAGIQNSKNCIVLQFL